MLADSIVQALMESDGVDPRELEADLRRTAALLRALVRTENRASLRTVPKRKPPESLNNASTLALHPGA
jgi:hypothetical protein